MAYGLPPQVALAGGALTTQTLTAVGNRKLDPETAANLGVAAISYKRGGDIGTSLQRGQEAGEIIGRVKRPELKEEHHHHSPKNMRKRTHKVPKKKHKRHKENEK